MRLVWRILITSYNSHSHMLVLVLVKLVRGGGGPTGSAMTCWWHRLIASFGDCLIMIFRVADTVSL